MDLQQRKLTRTEWNSIEVPVSPEEMDVLKLIIKAYHDVLYQYNTYYSLMSFMKTENSPAMENYLYYLYFAKRISSHIKKYGLSFTQNASNKIKIKKADMIRIQNTESKIHKKAIYENVLLDLVEKILLYNSNSNNKWLYFYYTLLNLNKYQVLNLSQHVKAYIGFILKKFEEDIDIKHIIHNADQYIEKNPYILQYADITLYTHQKQLFTYCKNPQSKMILYIAPTGTGKTLSPIGLSENNRIIFVCAARHVGLALAKAAISVRKKVAFAFGCNDPGDIRLHYFAAKEFIRNKRSGSIQKVDNSIGDKVEIMICDIKSYLPAMHYMCAFNEPKDLILYLDEPTITLDYETHEFHDIIKKNWIENVIPNVILSSATLPKESEITQTITSFRAKFGGSVVYNIISHDCKKTIPILNKNGFVEMPHLIFDNYPALLECVEHCQDYLTILRYLDLREIIKFIVYIDEHDHISKTRYKITNYFSAIEDITMNKLKIYYLNVLKYIDQTKWTEIYQYFQQQRKQRYNSTVYLTTKDAYTLTDGPTIYLATDVEKIAKFCIQSAKIPAQVMKDILWAIEFNNNINQKLDEKEKELEFKEGTGKVGSTTIKDTRVTVKKRTGGSDAYKEDNETKELKKTIEELQKQFKSISLNNLFIPNKTEHLDYWHPSSKFPTAFASDVSESIVERIIMLKKVEDSWKILLLMGIGVFTTHRDIEYIEVMKELATEQKLYLIIASTDYIYGTNYQFCHGYIGKDLAMLTQEKAIQAMGRVGRNKVQQDYTLRFRDDDLIRKLFVKETHRPEVINMNKLFSC